MSRRESQLIALLEQRPGVQPVRKFDAVVEKRRVDFALKQSLSHLLLLRHFELNFELWNAPDHFSQRCCYQPGRDVGRQSNAQPREFASAKPRCVLLGGLGSSDRLLEQRPHQAPEFGQLREIAFALEEATSELILETLNRSGQRWLRDVARLGGTGEVQGLAKCDEIPDLVQFHARSPETSTRPQASKKGAVLSSSGDDAHGCVITG